MVRIVMRLEKSDGAPERSSLPGDRLSGRSQWRGVHARRMVRFAQETKLDAAGLVVCSRMDHSLSDDRDCRMARLARGRYRSCPDNMGPQSLLQCAVVLVDVRPPSHRLGADRCYGDADHDCGIHRTRQVIEPDGGTSLPSLSRLGWVRDGAKLRDIPAQSHR